MILIKFLECRLRDFCTLAFRLVPYSLYYGESHNLKPLYGNISILPLLWGEGQGLVSCIQVCYNLGMNRGSQEELDRVYPPDSRANIRARQILTPMIEAFEKKPSDSLANKLADWGIQVDHSDGDWDGQYQPGEHFK